MNIALFLPGGVDKSGTERVVPRLLWFIQRLAKNHTVKVIVLRQYPHPCRYHLLGAEVINLGELSKANGRDELKMPARLRQISHAFDNFKPDVIHAVGALKEGILAGIWGKWHRIPVVVSIWSRELVWLPDIGYGEQGRWRTRFSVAIALNLANIITSGCRYTQNLCPYPSKWLPSGVDTTLFQPSSQPKPTDVLHLIHVAHVNKVKNQETLMKAVRLVADKVAVRLDWFGQDVIEKVPAFLQTHNLQNVVHFHGVQSINTLLPYYQKAHLFIQSSLHESQGVAVCEAAACGVPTVGTNVGLMVELGEKNAGITVPPRDPHALANAILQLWHNPKQRHALGHTAQQWATAHNADWTAQQFETLYSELNRKQ